MAHLTLGEWKRLSALIGKHGDARDRVELQRAIDRVLESAPSSAIRVKLIADVT